MDGLQIALDTLKFLEQNKDGLAAMVSASTLLTSTARGSIYVYQKGKNFISYLIKPKEKKNNTNSKKNTFTQKRKTTKLAEEGLQITKPDVAIIVDISRRALVDVASFLDQQKIEADIVMVTNDPSYNAQVTFLNPESNDEWNQIVLEFKTLMNKIKRAAGGRRVHIFLAAPLPLVFAMGAVWGTVDEAFVYHWENNTYYKVVNISRKLR